MISFESDYVQGAHPEILRRFAETNLVPQPGYGFDEYSASAKEKIRAAVGLDNADVEFIVGGTQANMVVISTMLADYEAVIAAKTGHISTHEAGAIEYSGHKVIELPSKEGKLSADDVRRYLVQFNADESREHMAIPGMVYVSYPTEYGTLYTKAELEALRNVCDEFGLKLFVDGARLGYGLASKKADLTLKELASLVDVFYIGGTKVGALCGEAIVFCKANKPAHFLTSVKRRGALVAKGRLLGIQFDTLFTNGLYFEISRHAIDMAEKLKAIFAEHGIKFFIDSPTNQQFVVLDNELIEKLHGKVRFEFWEKFDDNHTVVRFATSWATQDDDLKVLEKALDEI
ncbi:MAG: low specificity L-threonine aldolase [Clostridia bacterium]|nr:low specificity L-threonine aldolase [Clostridia bacterium]